MTSEDLESAVLRPCCNCGMILCEGENVELLDGTYCEDCAAHRDERQLVTDGGQSEAAIERNEDFEAPDGLEDRYESTIRQTVKILEDDEDRPEGIFLSIHRGDGIAFTAGMSPELVDGVGPTLPAVEMLAQHLKTVHQQTQGMSTRQLALLAADYSQRMGDPDE